MSETHYLISDASKKVDVESHVLRYWEEELEMNIPRNEMGHRYYTDFHIRLFKQIKDLKEKGYQLKAIKAALAKSLETDGEIVVPTEVLEEDVVAVLKECTDQEKAELEKMDQGELAALMAEEKAEQFRRLMSQMIGQAIEENNEKLSQDISKMVNDKVLKELDYLMRVADEKDEERFRQLDETIRLYQKEGKGRAEAAASRIPIFPYVSTGRKSSAETEISWCEIFTEKNGILPASGDVSNMPDKQTADVRILSESSENTFHSETGGLETGTPGGFLGSRHVIAGMIPGYDQERSQNDPFRIFLGRNAEQRIYGRIGFHGSQEDVHMPLVFETVIQSGIDGIGIMGGAVSHEDQHIPGRQVRKFCQNSTDDGIAVLIRGKKRIPETDALEVFGEFHGIRFHLFIFNAVQNMGGLYDHIPDSVFLHPDHGFRYAVNFYMISFQEPFADNTAGPGPVDPAVRAGLADILFDDVNGQGSGLVDAGAETDHQDCFFCGILQGYSSVLYQISMNEKATAECSSWICIRFPVYRKTCPEARSL